MSTYPHTRRRQSLGTLLFWACMLIPASALLYGVSAKVQEQEKELASLKTQIVAEQEGARVLKAEWAYLNNPQKLAARAKTYLGFQTGTSAKQIASLNDMAVKVAYRTEVPAALTEAPATAQVADATPAPRPSTRMLAKPIGYEQPLVDQLGNSNVTIPAAAGWDGHTGSSDVQ